MSVRGEEAEVRVRLYKERVGGRLHGPVVLAESSGHTYFKPESVHHKAVLQKTEQGL